MITVNSRLEGVKIEVIGKRKIPKAALYGKRLFERHFFFTNGILKGCR